MTRIAISFALLLGVATSAFAQIDASGLRTQYGTPIDRETFMVRPGIEMVVDYGPNKQVCRIQLPSGMNIVGTIPAGAITKQQIDEVFEEVVPPAIRGKKINGFSSFLGSAEVSVTEYEHVTVSDLKIGNLGQGITVTFKYLACPKRRGP